jgi:UDP-N-acetylmuramoyl-L-alanyl-D-glutamate--2,6-diaminopimelate ligase
MKKLNDLYQGIGTDIVVRGIKNKAADLSKDDLFVFNIENISDYDYFDEAIKKEACAVVTNKSLSDYRIPIITVPDASREYPYLCQKFYDFPDRKMQMIGITGSNGKTSTSFILQSILGANTAGYIGPDGRRCAAFSDTDKETMNSYKIYNTLDEFNKFGCKYGIIEGNDKSLANGQLQSIDFDISVFTNLVNEYLDNNKFINYYNAIIAILNKTKDTGYSVLNSDDPVFSTIKDFCKGKIVTYGRSADSTLQIVDYKINDTKTVIKFKYGDEEFEITSSLLGVFNVYNLAASILTALTLGYKIDNIVSKIQSITVPGRMNFLNTDSTYYVLVDYAHTINTISKVMEFVNTLDIGNKYIVFSSALDLDIDQLNCIGRLLCEQASHVIFSYDDNNQDVINNVSYILGTIKGNYNNYSFVEDRKDAINKAIELAKDKDIVLILGKGDKSYQNLGFNDTEVAYQAIALKKIKESNS